MAGYPPPVGSSDAPARAHVHAQRLSVVSILFFRLHQTRLGRPEASVRLWDDMCGESRGNRPDPPCSALLCGFLAIVTA